MNKKILLVDDDKDLTTNIEQVLRVAGFEVAVAHSATDGLKRALAFRPQVIILDVSMETDTAGFEFAGQLRSKRDSSRYKEIRTTPIIMLTAINQVTNNRFSLSDKESYLPDVQDIFTKPVPIDALIAKVKQLT